MDPNSQRNSYDKLYKDLRSRADGMHENNKKMIRIGSIGIVIMPVILFLIRWMTDSNKVVFLLIWVFCLFGLAIFLIAVEYLDKNIQSSLGEMTDRNEEFDDLVEPPDLGHNNRIAALFRRDFKRLTSSVVTIIVVVGLCIIPCLYAWFNIFSNWDPYSSTATGRIPVAVVNDDEGAELMGLNINVGEKVTEALDANRSIGWAFVDSRERALEGVRAGDYYAAIVIPEEFSSDVMSFTTGDLKHPELDYYENLKKNAVAPKITNKAKEVLEEELDAAFIETLGKYVSEAKEAADANGLDPEDVFTDIGSRIGLLSERMDDLVVLVTATQGLSDAAGQLIQASEELAGSTADALETGDKILEDAEGRIPGTEQEGGIASSAVKKEADTIAAGLVKLQEDLNAAGADMDSFNDFVLKDLESHRKLVSDMASSAKATADQLTKLGFKGLGARFGKMSDRLKDIERKLNGLEKADDTTWAKIKEDIGLLLVDVNSEAESARSISEDVGNAIDDKITRAINDTKTAIGEIRSSIEESYGDLDSLNEALSKSENALKYLDRGTNMSLGTLMDMQESFTRLSKLFDSMADSDQLKNVNYLLSDGTDVISKNLASPIRMETKTVYPVKNFGSVMASFYTTLAQWVGALFASLMIRARVSRRKEEDGIPEPSLIRQFFGRYRLFLMIGILQAMILTSGELFYMGIQCDHPVRFVITACVNGVVFSMINHALAFALGKLGNAVSLIILILQVAGSGGTFPPEVLPQVFRSLYPFMPFHYSLNGMRECIAGMYGSEWAVDMAMLLIMGAVAMVIGLLLARPGGKLNDVIDKSLENNDIMEW